MCITVNKGKIVAALTALKGIIDTKGIPILRCVKVVVRKREDGGEGMVMDLTATDLNIELRNGVECDADGEVSFCLPLPNFATFASCLPDGQIVIEVGPKQCKIVGGRCQYGLTVEDAEQFPVMKDPEKLMSWTIAAEALKTMICRVRYAISKDDTRLVIKGACLQFGQDKMTMIATNGRTLAAVEYDKPEMAGIPEIIIPAAAISAIVTQLAQQKEGSVRIISDHERVRIFGSGWVLTARMISEKYPNWRQVIPRAKGDTVKVDRKELLDEIERVSAASPNGKGECPYIELGFTKSNLVLKTQSGGVCDAGSGVPIKYDGTEMEIKFAPGYLIEMLSSLDAEELTLKIVDPGSPMVVEDRMSFLGVVMPLRMH